MAAPTRFTSGVTQAASWQPLGNIGIPDPFFYATFHDDFLPYQGAKYTVTASGGSVAQTLTNGSGGRILFTSGATSGNFAEIQMEAFGFVYTAGKKLAYLTRVNLTDITNSAFIGGMISSNTTPFSAVADGVYFYKAAAGTTLQLIAVTGSTVIGTASVTGALTAGSDIDLGFYIDSRGNIRGFYGNSLEGWKNQNSAILGPNIALLSTSLTGAITTASLTPTLAIAAGTGAAQTMNSDFLFGAMER